MNTIDMMFHGVPKVWAEGATSEEPVCLAGNYVYRTIGIEEAVFYAYLKEVEEAGFEKKADNTKGLRDIYYSAIFQKDERMLHVFYIKVHKMMFASVYGNPYCPTWNADDLFRKIPEMKGYEESFHEKTDYGAGNYVVTIDHVFEEAYLGYLTELEAGGFTKYVDNGDGLNNSIFSSTYTKEEIVVTLTFAKKTRRLSVSACLGQALSDHLFYNAKDVVNAKKMGKTSLHMLQLKTIGNSFVFQLKNGHFVISDGGIEDDMEVLLDYLEELAPTGEKPIVEGWFISHAHRDHCGVFRKLLNAPDMADRIYVEGIYYNEPNASVIALEPWTGRGYITAMRDAVKFLNTTKGTTPYIYRPQTGQRYYFHDITVDILVGQEQLPYEDYSGDFNDSSTWCMFTIEGQKCLLGGDGDKGAFKFIMENYDREYMEVDLFSLLHHGHNVKEYFVDYCTVKTVLVTNGGALPAYREKEIAYFKKSVQEWISWEDGTKIFEFPYQVGEGGTL